MITCPSCGRENAGHFNFCLDCGTELPRGAAAAPAVQASSGTAPALQAPAAPPREDTRAQDAAAFEGVPTAPYAGVGPKTTETPPVSSGQIDGATATFIPEKKPQSASHPVIAPATRPPVVTAPPPAAPLRPSTVAAAPAAAGGLQICNICKSTVPAGMKFCGECGSRIDEKAPLPNPSSQAAAQAKQTQFLHVADIAAVQAPKARLIVIDPSGREGMTFNLKAAETLCGRVNGIILFEDPFVSPTHCRFLLKERGMTVQDASSVNGVYIRLRAEVELKNGDLLRLGRQLLRFEDAGSLPKEPVARQPDDDAKLWGSPDPACFGRLVMVMEDGRDGDVRVLRGDEIKIGRDAGDIVFPQDGFVSGRHCVLSSRTGKVFLRDVGSSNGTYLRVRGEKPLFQDDFILVGNQMMRVDLR